MLDRNIHRTILLQILKDIYSNASLGPILGFKGGTAAHFFHGLDRFSIDLDFDLLDETNEDGCFQSLERVLGEYGVVKEKSKKANTLFFLLAYGEKTRNVKVEISRRNFGSHYDLKNHLGVSMLVMTKQDMFAHKLIAMMERHQATNRDVYDVWYFLKNRWPISREIVEMRSRMSYKDYLKKCAIFVESMSDRNILSGMGDLLNSKRSAWVKTNLKNDTAFLLKVRLEQEK